MRFAVSLAIVSALACGTSKTAQSADSASVKDAGQVTDSILPSGPMGAVTSTSSTPSTQTATPPAVPNTPAPPKRIRGKSSGSSSTKTKSQSGVEKDSATAPKFSIDEQGTVRPVKH